MKIKGVRVQFCTKITHEIQKEMHKECVEVEERRPFEIPLPPSSQTQFMLKEDQMQAT